MRRWRPLTAVLLAALIAALVAAPARAADHGIQLLSSQRLDSRLTELTLSTQALRQPTAGPTGSATCARRFHRSSSALKPEQPTCR